MRLIDADEYCREHCIEKCSESQKSACSIGMMPTVEARRVVHGEWKYNRKENIATCKNCSYEHYLGTYHQYATNFCPRCGADMRKKE